MRRQPRSLAISELKTSRACVCENLSGPCVICTNPDSGLPNSLPVSDAQTARKPLRTSVIKASHLCHKRFIHLSHCGDTVP